jgi:hypothetical protein
MLDLHLATAALTCGLFARLPPPEALLLLAALVLVGAALLVVEVAAGVELAVVALLLLLLLPQPASSALPTAARASRELSLLFIDPPQGLKHLCVR